MNNSDKVFNEYTPFRNYVRSLKLTPSLLAIHAHAQFMQFSVPLPTYITGTPMGYKDSKTMNDFLTFHLHPWDLEVLAKEILIYSPMYGGDKNMQEWNFLSNAVNRIRGIERKITELYINSSNVLREMARISHRQFVWQKRPDMDTIAFYWNLYSNEELQKIIIRTIGLTVDEIYVVGFMLTGFYLDKFALLYPINIQVPDINIEKLNKFLNKFSIDLDSLREKLKSEQQMNDKYVYAYHSLKTYPIIKTTYENRDALICPLPTLLYRRITDGLYYEICNQGGFDQAFGNAFQNNIGILLKEGNPEAELYPEEKYGKSEKRTVDWIVEDKSAFMFIECKTKRMKMEAKVSLDTDELDIQLDKMADFIIQTYKSYLEYKNNRYPQLKFNPNKKVYIVIVTLEEWFLFGDDLMGKLAELVNQKFEKENLPLELLESNPYTICSVESLDTINQISSQIGINSTLEEKTRNLDFRMYHIDNYLRDKFSEQIINMKNIFSPKLSEYIDKYS